MKFKSFTTGAIFVLASTAVLTLLFQNCNNLSSQKNLRLPSNLLGSYSFLNSAPSFSTAKVEDYYSNSRGFIFYGKYDIAHNSADKTGAQICDYPSLSNCHVHAEGQGRGASTIMNSGLNPNSNVHLTTFQFYSDGFLTKNKDSHFALGLRGTFYLGKGVDGRGAILGNLWGIEKNQANPDCHGMMMQVESFFASNAIANKGPGNTVYPETCSGALFKERTLYNMEVYVSRSNKIGYKVKDTNGRLIMQKIIQDSYDLIDKNLTDAFIAHVFDININSRSDEWSLIIDKINFTESNSTIESFFPSAVPRPTQQPNSSPPPPVVTPPVVTPPVVIPPVTPSTAVPFRAEDFSYGDGVIIKQIHQKIYGVGFEAKACTNPMSQYNNACKNISDFRPLKEAWGAGAYDATNDIWTINSDISANRYPFTNYFSRFILSNGAQKEAQFTPSRIASDW